MRSRFLSLCVAVVSLLAVIALLAGTVMAALREVIETRGLFCSLYSDRGSHFFVTVREGESVDKSRLTRRRPEDDPSGILGLGKGGCHKNCGWQESRRGRRRIGFCESTTSENSMPSSWWPPRRKERLFDGAAERIWTGSSPSKQNGWWPKITRWRLETDVGKLRRADSATL